MSDRSNKQSPGPTKLAESARNQDFLAAVRDAFEHGIPHNRVLGLDVRSISGSEVTLVMRFAEHNADARGGLHPSAIAAAIDAACGAAVFAKLKSPRRVATLDLRVDHITPSSKGQPVRVVASCDRVEGDVAYTRATAHCDESERELCRSVGTFALSDSNVPPWTKERPR